MLWGCVCSPISSVVLRNLVMEIGVYDSMSVTLLTPWPDGMGTKCNSITSHLCHNSSTFPLYTAPASAGFPHVCVVFSADCSDWQHMDVEDQHSDKSQSRGSECAETSQPGQNREPGERNSENSTLMLAGRELPPIYIIDHMGLKQVRLV